MSLDGARTFLLGAYHDLPNVLFVGSLILGSITGYMPLVWVSVGLLFNGAVVGLLQSIASFVFPQWKQIAVPAGSGTCEVLGRMRDRGADAVSYVAPSQWLAATVFFAAFTIINSVMVMSRKAADGVAPEKVDARNAYTVTVLLTGVVFLILALLRALGDCETGLGAGSGVVVGAGLAWAFLS